MTTLPGHWRDVGRAHATLHGLDELQFVLRLAAAWTRVQRLAAGMPAALAARTETLVMGKAIRELLAASGVLSRQPKRLRVQPVRENEGRKCCCCRKYSASFEHADRGAVVCNVCIRQDRIHPPGAQAGSGKYTPRANTWSMAAALVLGLPLPAETRAHSTGREASRWD